MIIKIQNPPDSFDLLEVIEFSYKAIAGQVSKKTLKVRVKKYKQIGLNDYVYSDEPEAEVFIKNIDSHLMQDAINGENTCANALGANMYCVAKLIAEKGIECLVEA